MAFLSFVDGVSSCHSLVVQRKGGAIVAEEAFSWRVRLANVPISLCRYLGKIVLPLDLSPYYPHPISWPIYQIVMATAAALTLSGLTFFANNKNPFLLFGWLWFLITLLPVLGLIQVGTQSIADRYTYIPSIGLFVAICWLFGDLTRQLRSKKIVLAVLTLLALLGCSFATAKQIDYWKDSETLFRHALRVQSNNPLAHLDLGIALHGRGQLETALVELDAAVRLDPNAAIIYFNRGWVLSDLGRYDEALRDFQTGLRISPESEKTRSRISRTDAIGHLLFGIALHRVGARTAAIEEFRTAIHIQPDLLEAYNNLGMLYREEGNLDAAIQAYRSALAIRPAFSDAHNNLAIALSLQNHPQEAVAEFKRAIELAPSSPAFHTNLGAQFEQLYELNEAIAEYRQALRLAPDYMDAKEKLDQALARRQKGAIPGPK
jgi:tetratricopeptide (TPR) repeat protein